MRGNIFARLKVFGFLKPFSQKLSKVIFKRFYLCNKQHIVPLNVLAVKSRVCIVADSVQKLSVLRLCRRNRYVQILFGVRVVEERHNEIFARCTGGSFDTHSGIGRGFPGVAVEDITYLAAYYLAFFNVLHTVVVEVLDSSVHFYYIRHAAHCEHYSCYKQHDNKNDKSARKPVFKHSKNPPQNTNIF